MGIITNHKPIILLQHGLLDCSDSFIINDEDKAPAFILANKGYDVYLKINWIYLNFYTNY